MKILHGTWIPEPKTDFVQTGAFYLWVETAEQKKRSPAQIHPRQLVQADLAEFLTQEFGIKPSPYQKSLAAAIEPQYFLLPSANGQPLPSLELARFLETELPEEFEWQYWRVDCFPTTLYRAGAGNLNNVIHLLNDLHFIALHNLVEVQLGADLLFWYSYSQAFKQIIFKDQYIPALKYRQVSQPQNPIQKVGSKQKTTRTPKAAKSKTSKSEQAESVQAEGFEIYAGWEIISEQYEADLERFAAVMPLVCLAGAAEPLSSPQLYDPVSLLRHFSECLLTQIVTQTPSSNAFEQKIADTLVYSCLKPDQRGMPWTTQTGWELYQQWQVWRDRISRSQTEAAFHLCFQLQEPAKSEESWQLEFQIASRQDPSLRLPLIDYWRMRPKQQKDLQKQFGQQFEQNLLLNLGYAARIYSRLWTGLETDQPTGIFLDLAAAFEFLKESAWVLEDAGYKVIVPAWWTPQGRRRAKVRLKAKGKSLSASNKSKSYFSHDTLVEYQYELAIGGEKISEQEWQQLVGAKTPLVLFRGQWMALDQSKMREMLEFWKKHQQEHPEMSLLEFMQMTAGQEDDLDLAHDRALAEMLTKLHDPSRFEPITEPALFQGQLREYQKRGVSWLHYLEGLGLNGCLADDMGLGKSAQVIARLVQEREHAKQNGKQTIPPTLLIAPTSVVGNWQKEIEKFAPHLRAIAHHGSQRQQDQAEFRAALGECDVVITSFTLARKDAKLLESIDWHRLVVDEAQNIKNPKAAQTKAILKLPAQHRLALTGTPVENRLLDLWSIFNFLNPGYLGKEAQFRQSFEIPIQKNNDRVQAGTLKKLVEPFILRRLKTDQSIIKDLPDKLEQKQFCNLTKEQASLYAVVVKEIEGQLEEAEGIQRKGMILATLMKLKQICNHPMQFLQDGSEFSPERSHKLSRLSEMSAEAISEGESLLVFTQFTEIGAALERFLKPTVKTFYLHGGTSAAKRQKMIGEFQDPETEPSVFILSLKAGGVGITLTKANHVFHFDRWWNPAVEDQATDRAFRIGQKKNVFVHKFVAIGTLEEKIDQMIEDKKKLAGAIVGADESWLTELDNNAFKQLITLNKNAILD
ncbi:MAG: DEAD/DEAH box helicase [Aphanocapsa sp. GSE-SYN-MK-11-07L]|jgi:SNF2 family DNA or RNA helicase|nr:DEAD/DEAH box helicase [Aphanocapsa sp. GSE-SYN-MK-11-07L]